MASRPTFWHSLLEFHRTSLGLCALQPPSAAAAATAALWHNRLLLFGTAPPLFVTHDLGWVLGLSSADRRDAGLFRPVGGHRRSLGPSSAYSALIRELLDCTPPIAEALARCHEEVRVALLSYLLLPLCRAYGRFAHESLPAQSELPVAGSAYPTPSQYGQEPWERQGGVASAQGDSTGDPLEPARAFAAFLVEQGLSLRTQIELIDVDVLRLLGTTSARSARDGLSKLGEGAALHLPDLMQIVSAEVPDVRDMVRFSQELLPAVLEPQRSDDRQRYPLGGHASIERHGSIDSLLGSELVFDDTLFLHRLSDGEALYYGRERPREDRPGPVHILVDASASMRGQRQVFARGLAWALGRRLSARRSVTLRFFDGRLYDAQPIAAGSASQEALLSLMSFRSQRGRNYARVFSDLLRELRGPRPSSAAVQPESGRASLYIVTHGECHVPSRLIQDIAAHADLYAVFVMPSGPLRIEYLPWLAGYQVVDEAALEQRDERRRLALRLIDRAASSARQVSVSP